MEDAVLNEILSNVPEYDADRNYWLVRTNGGKYYSTFIKNNFIGIEYIVNEKDLVMYSKEANPMNIKIVQDELKASIKKGFKNLTEEQIIKKVDIAFSQLNHFIFDFKVGDIIIIVGLNSNILSICEISSNKFTYHTIKEIQSSEIEYPFNIRRSVKWLKLDIPKTKVDSEAYKMFFTQRTISKVDRYNKYINDLLGDIYISDEKLYAKYEYLSENSINIDEMAEFINTSKLEFEKICRNNNVEYLPSNFTLKLKINSPGWVQFVFDLTSMAVVIPLSFIVNSQIEGNTFLPNNISGNSEEKFIASDESTFQPPKFLRKSDESDKTDITM